MEDKGWSLQFMPYLEPPLRLWHVYSGCRCGLPSLPIFCKKRRTHGKFLDACTTPIGTALSLSI